MGRRGIAPRELSRAWLVASRVGFDFSFSNAPAPRGASGTVRLLVLADFVGMARPAQLLRKVDVDNLEATLAAVAPTIKVDTAAGDGEATLTFASLDDFHPDELLKKVPSLVELAATRRQLADPRTFAPAAARLLRTATPASPTDSLFANLMGGTVRKAEPAAQAAEGLINNLLKQAVAPHLVPAAAPEQGALLDAVETSLSQALRHLLHTPAFGRVEAAWRGMEHLIGSVPHDGGVEVWLCTAPLEALLRELQQSQGDYGALHATTLSKLLLNPDGPAFSAVVVDAAFGEDQASLLTLSALAAVAGRAGASVLATASAALVGLSENAELDARVGGRQGDLTLEETYASLRESPLAPHVGLVFPRWLLRLPYGTRRNEVQAFAFDELGTKNAPAPERLLWGTGALLAAAALAGAFAASSHGTETGVDDPTVVEGAQVFTYVDEHGNKLLFPPTGTWLSEPQANALLERGVMPLIAHRQLAQARFLRLQSIAKPARALVLKAV